MRVIKSPLIMIRKAGLPSRYNFDFGSCQLKDNVVQLSNIEESLEISKNQITDSIESKIQFIEDDADIKKLINIKRAIYNLKPKALKMIEENQELFVKYDLLDKANKFKEFFSEKIDLDMTINNDYDDTLNNEKDLIYDAFKKYPNILKGVNFVHPTIVSNITKPDFLAKFKHNNAKTRNMTNTLGKVITRTAYKASPFSTLTSVGVGEWENSCELNTENNSEYYKSFTVTRFNQAYGFRVFEKVLELPEVRYRIPYTFADTLSIKNGKFYFTSLQDDGGKVRTKVYKTIDQLVILSAVKSIEGFYSKYKESSNFNYEDFKNYFYDLGYPDDEITKLFDKLVSQAFLTPAIYLRQQSDCIIDECLNKIKLVIADEVSDKLKEIIEKLEIVRDELARFDSLDYKGQQDSLGRISKNFRQAASSLNLEYIEEKSLLYQDSLIDEEYKIDEQSYEEVLKTFVLFSRFANIFDVLQRFQLKAGKSFHDKFGEKEVEVSTNEKDVIDTFINEIVGNGQFWTDQFKMDTQHYGIKDLDELNGLKNNFIKELYTMSKDNSDEINLSKEIITTYIDGLPTSISGQSQSNSFFFQNLKENKIVLNHLYAGNAIFYLRFLKNLEKYMKKEEYQSYLKEIIHNRNIIDIYLGFGFNANLRESITEDAISLPNNKIKDIDKFRNVYDWKSAKFKYNSKTKKVDMYFNDEKKIVQFLGTLSTRLLPGIPGMLHIMNSGVVFLKDVGSMVLHQYMSETDGDFEIMKFPRIWFNDNMVISRKKWFVNSDILRVYSELEDREYLKEIIRFWDKHGLPRKIFAYKFIHDEEDLKDSDNSSNKPQYVDVSSPILVSIFKKLVEGSRYVVLEEVLPNLDNDDSKHEFIDEKTIEITMMED